MSTLCHTATYRGKRVLVTLRSGEQFVDRFVERTPKKFVVFEGRKVRVGDIKQFITSPKIIAAMGY